MRRLFAIVALASCYAQPSVTPCALTCNASSPCPGDLVCGADLLCHGAGLAPCSSNGDDASVVDGSVVDGSVADGSVDAPAFQVPGDCPADYSISIVSASVSRYRVLPLTVSFWTQEADCADDVVGATHLVVAGTTAELDELVTAINMPSQQYFYAGAVQGPAATVGGNWIGFDGMPVVGWLSGEPNDGGTAGEGDHRSQVAWFDPTSARLSDASGAMGAAAVCECDGVPIHPMARSYIDSDPNNPN